MDRSKFAVNTYNKIAQIYTDKYFNDLTGAPYIDKFLNKLSLNAKLLDVGCGPGTFSKYLVEKGFSVEGVDLGSPWLFLAGSPVWFLFWN